MSTHALEQALWEIGRDPALAAAFRADPAAFAARYRLSTAELDQLASLDVQAMAAAEVSTLLLMMAWIAVHGPGSVPGYMARMHGQPAG